MCLVERDDQFSKWAYTMQYVSKFKTFKLITTILCSLVIALVVLSTTVSRQVLERQEQLLTNMINNKIIVSVEHGEFLNESQINKVYEMQDFKAIKPFSYMNASIDGLEIVIQPYHEYMAYDIFKQGNDRTFVSYALNEKISSSQLDVDIFLDGHPYALENTPISIDATLESRQVNPYGKNPYVIYLDEQQYQSLYQKLCDMNGVNDHRISKLLLYTKSYELVYQAKVNLEKLFNKATVTCAFIDMKSINESSQAMFYYLKMVSYALFIIMTCMLVLIYSRYLRNREAEFYLLQANGLQKKKVSQLLGCDITIQAVFFSVETMGFIFAFCLLLKLPNVSYVALCVPVILISMFILLLPTILSLKSIRRYSVAQFLRT